MKRKFRRNKINLASVVTIILAVTAGVVTFGKTFFEGSKASSTHAFSSDAAKFSEAAGTSTLAAGLAASFSEINDDKALLVDIQLGPEDVHPFFEGKPACSLHAALKPNGSIDSAADNLYLATVGPSNAGLAQFGLKKFPDTMPNLNASDFDYIIFDIPLLGQTSSTWRKAAFMDELLLVVEAENNSRELIKRDYRELETFGKTTAYTVSELSGAGDTGRVPCRLNNLGDVAGRGGDSPSGETRATVWNRGSLRPTNLGKFDGGDYSSASGINDAGEVAGAANMVKSIVPFVWTPTGGLGRIPLLPGDNCGQAFGINNYGHVAGYSSGPKGRKAFLWTRSAGVHNLGVLAGGNYSTACDINDLDEVAGTSASAAGNRAFLWTKTGNMRDLGTLPGDTSSDASAINNNGDVIGYSKGPRGMRAFLWTKATGMQDLGVLPGGNSSRALGINDMGAVVGSSTSSSGDRAVIWTKQAGMRDLNSAASVTFGVVFVEAHAINHTGQILVMASPMHESHGSGEAAPHCAPAPPSSFLLTPASQ
jgi:probable HAF family extracellular repeat protein